MFYDKSAVQTAKWALVLVGMRLFAYLLLLATSWWRLLSWSSGLLVILCFIL